MASVEFRLPDLGENIESGDVVNVLVAPGDTIAEDQPIIELETDKAVIEVPSPVSGVVHQVHVKAGEKAKVGQLVITVEAGEKAVGVPAATAAPPSPPVASPAPSPAAAPAATGSLIEFHLPDLGENIESGDVVHVLVTPGDTVAEDQPVIELETDKAVVEVPSPVAGVIREVHVRVGEKAKVGQLIVTVEAAGTAEASSAATTIAAAPPTMVIAPAPPAASPSTVAAVPASPTATVTPPARPTPETSAPAAAAGPRPLVPAAPSVRRLAREIGVDLTQVAGSGPGSRISEADVKEFARRQSAAPTATAHPAAMTGIPGLELPDFTKWGPVDRQPMSKVRRITAERLTQAWTNIPQVTVFDHADVTELEQWRKENGKRVEAAGGKLTPTVILLKVVAIALRRFPDFNASVDMARGELVFKQYCHVGVAVDTDRGLLVPVIREVDRKNLIQLATELSQIAEKARTRKLTPDEMQGGCFTVSNLGGIGGLGFTPIINPPEVAILGVARAALQPVYRDGELRPRLMMPLSLTFDHRLIDGASGARFLRWIAQVLENPFHLLL